MHRHKSLVVCAVLTLCGTALALPAQASKAFEGKCLLEVAGKTYLKGACPIVMEDDGGFSIGASEDGPIGYFAIVSVSGKDVGEGYWNEDEGANHAHTPLGRLNRKGACWQNEGAKVCAWR
jgi:hypothetical protein